MMMTLIAPQIGVSWCKTLARIFRNLGVELSHTLLRFPHILGPGNVHLFRFRVQRSIDG